MNTSLLKFVRENLQLKDGQWEPNPKSSIWFYSTIFPFFPLLIAIKLIIRKNKTRN